MILAWVLACGHGGGDAALAPPPAVWVEAQKVASGGPVLLHAPPDATVAPGEGLAADARGDGVWALSGADGSYVVEVTPAGAPAPQRVFVDIGVTGPSGGPMDDLVGLAAEPPPVWPWVVGGLAATAALVAAGLWAARRYAPRPPPPPPEPAHVVARRAWTAARARPDLAAEQLARELSAIYRRYVEASHGWPATARTSREIVDNLAGELTAAQLDCARRLLGAMDLVKFADREARLDLFDALDHDFDALVRRA